MENKKRDHHDQDHRDSQYAEEFINASPNTNENPNPAIEHTEYENKRLDTDPNRYAHFADRDRSVDDDSDDSGHVAAANEESARTTEERHHYSSEDDRRVGAADEEEPHLRSDSRSDEAADSDQMQFFDGL